MLVGCHGDAGTQREAECDVPLYPCVVPQRERAMKYTARPGGQLKVEQNAEGTQTRMEGGR